VDGTKSEILMKNADSAMYQAKLAGRNNYQFYDESLNNEVVQRFTLEQDIRMALKKEEFVLFYQPKVELASGRIVGAEALIRWFHPVKGMVPPDQFISVAEETGLITEINRWVIQTACRHCASWSVAGQPDLQVAVNLSGYQFAEQNFSQEIRKSLRASGLAPQQLEVEITENILMHETSATVAVLEEIRAQHVGVSLDDFGTGYSSLSYLTSFPVDKIKIDRTFVMGSSSQKKNRIIIRAIIALGHSLGLKIVAEGIETEEQLEMLKEYGCDEGQGYYFKHPVPMEDFVKILARNRAQGGF
jgi:EAL domain-containing protein (putative c-di-GMP-specific phosphodiesterase class I)